MTLIMPVSALPIKGQVLESFRRPWEDIPRRGEPVVFRQAGTGQKVGGVVVEVDHGGQSYRVWVGTDAYL